MLTPTSPSPSLAQEIDSLRHHWPWFLALGIAMVVLGTIAIGDAVIATVATSMGAIPASAPPKLPMAVRAPDRM